MYLYFVLCVSTLWEILCLVEQRGHVVSSTVRFGISVDDNDNIKPGRITMKPGSQSQNFIGHATLLAAK